MIEISNLRTKDIGRWVEFDDGHRKKKGVIKFWNTHGIFVVFSYNDDWNNYKNYTAERVNPSYLKFSLRN